MKIVVIGTGYVGLVTGTCLAEFGHEVHCIDKQGDKIHTLQKGGIPIYEPGLKEIVVNNTAARRLFFSTDASAVLPEAEYVFLAVGTPSRGDEGAADLSYVFSALEEVAPMLPEHALVVTKSTVPVGTGKKVQDILARCAPGKTLHVVSNPEFLREGAAVYDFMHPDRIVIGVEGNFAESRMRQLYHPLVSRGVPLLFTNIATAELIKYASNAFLATKIAFMNEMADICEQVGANVIQVAKGMGMDPRIGATYLHPGPGYGGSCFPKDTKALAYSARNFNVPSAIVETVIASNEARKNQMVQRIVQACGGEGQIKGKVLGILGVTFKANTDDMRDSPSLAILPALADRGVTLQAYDPAGMNNAKLLLPKAIHWCQHAADVAKGADGLVIITEWEVFTVLDYKALKKHMRGKVIVDLRNLLDRKTMEGYGFDYYGIGS